MTIIDDPVDYEFPEYDPADEPPPPGRPSHTGPQRIHNAGLIIKFTGEILRNVVNGEALRFSGEVIRQAGIIVTSSMVVIWGLVFIVGLQCGIEGAYLLQSQGAPQYAGLFAAWCDLRELVPLSFGYMMAAKVGTGIVAEVGSMRISEEIDALEVMGVNGIAFLCSTRIIAAWLVLPFVYIGGMAFGFLASYISVVEQVANVSSGGYTMIFWEFQNPGDLLFSLIKAMAMATMIVLVGCYYGYNASGGPVGVGVATAKSMVVNIVGVHVISMLGTQLFWGANPRAPIGG